MSNVCNAFREGNLAKPTWRSPDDLNCGRSPRWRTLRAGVFIVAFITVNSLSADPRNALLDELEARSLDRLIEVYCREQLGGESLRPDERADLVIAWVTARARQACDARQLANDLSWQAIDELATEQQQSVASEFEVARIDLRRIAIQVLRAERLIRTAALDADAKTHRDRAQQILRQAERSLKELASNVPRTATSAQSVDDVSPAGRVRDLTERIALQRGQLLLLHAELYDPGTADHVHLLTQAIEACSSLSRQLDDSPLADKARVIEIQCQLQLENLTQAEQLMEAVRDSSRGEDSRLEQQEVILRAELLRRQQQLDEAVSLLETAILEGVFDADLPSEGQARLTLIRFYLALQASAQDQQTWQQRALQQVRVLEDRLSPYWVRQAEALLAGHASGITGESRVDVLARAAANFYRRQQFEEARVSFSKAAATAKDLGLSDRAFELSFQAAAIAHQRQQFDVAASDFANLANEFSTNPKAADAHWLSIVDTAQLVKSNPSTLPLYETRLVEHIAHWPESRSTHRASLWLSRLRLQQNRPADALNHLHKIPIEFEDYQQVATAVRDAHILRLLSTTDADDRQRLATEAVRSLHDDFSSLPAAENLDRRLQSAAAGLIVSASELALLFTRAGPREATRQLDRMYLVDEIRERYEHPLNALRGLQSALAGDADNAKKYWQSVDWNEVELAPYYLERLDAAANDAPNYAQRLSQLQSELASTQRRTDRWQGNVQVQLALAAATGRLGEREAAVAIYQQILQQDPTRIDALEALAAQQEIDDSEPSTIAALESWRRVVQLSAPRSESWYRAKVGIARALVRSGQRQRAAEMIRVLKAVDPSLGGSPFKQQFESILAAAVSSSG